MRKWLIGLGLAFTIGIVAVAYVPHWAYNAKPVQVVRAKRGNLAEELRITGRIEAVEAEVIRAREAFRIEKVLVEEGKAVKAGQKLLDIDRTDKEDAVNRARLKLEQAEIALEETEKKLKASERAHSDPTELETTLRVKEAEYKEAVIEREAAERELHSSRRLYDLGGESLLRLKAKEDRARAARVRVALKEEEFRETKQLVAKKEKTHIKLAAVRGEYEIALRKKALAEAELELCLTQLKRLRIASSMNGDIVSIQIEDGMYVSQGQELLTVADLGRLQVEADVDELDASRIREGQRAIVTFDGFPGKEWGGRVTEIAPQAVIRDDRAVVKTVILLEEARTPLRIANQVDVRVGLGKKPAALHIPLSAVHQGDRPFVWLHERGVARMRKIVVGFSNLDNVEIKQGLKEGDEVIITHRSFLRDGDRVRVRHSE
jgi:HlyD family secretion protein